MKKRIVCAFIAVLMIILILPIQAFAAENIKGAYVNQNFESTIDTVLGATRYSVGGNVPAGLKVSGSWSRKNTFGDVVFKAVLSGKPTTAGTYNFSVNYLKDDGTTLVTSKNYTVVVGEKSPFDYVKSIQVDKWPNKTVYYLRDTVDLTGMKVSAVVYNYNPETDLYEPSVIDVTDLVWVEPTVFTYDEPQNVEVFLKAPADSNGNLQTFRSHFRVEFNYANPEDITRIEIYQKPSKLTYTVGESLDLTGMTLRAHKGNGTAEEITSGFTADITKLEEVGTETVTVSYTKNEQTFTATFDVTVKEAVSSQPEEEEPKEESSSSSSSEPEEEPSSSEPEVPDETSSEEEPVIEEPSSSEPEVPDETSSESEPDIIVTQPEPVENEKTGVPFWAWIIIVLLVILIAAAVALFLIGRKRISDDDYDDED
ncbi:MAG: bacterial Ig-like domain-containing protein [Oscillospiraceae bacterium]|nr:bacterial Ig-like domain-containing protein [Oscillospiraceae bacterium]